MAWLATAAATLVALRPTAQVEQGACTRRHASGCTLCVDACPKGALAITDLAVGVDADACVGCGLCVTTCPVGALTGVGQLPAVVAGRLEAGDVLRCDAARILAPDDDRACTDVPCLAGVHPEALAAGALSRGAATVVRADCEACPVGAGARVRAVLASARDIVGASGSAAHIAEEQVADAAPRRWARRSGARRANRAAPEVSRRSLFGLRADAEPEPAPRSALAGLSSSAGARQALLAATPEPALPQLAATSDCTACGGCVRVCPTDALSLDAGELRLSPDACVGCGECVRVCPEDALRPAPPAPAPGRRVLVRVEERRCGTCARPLGPGEGATCHHCTTRGSLTAGIWAQLA